jgi:2-polyprenyl-3-methyl-5-hydroxy-6-metoxy-1,4-benzoquinol methylase
MTAVDRLHGGFVHPRRVQVLAAHAARLVPPRAHVLDVGTGDGRIAAALGTARPDLRIEGIDVLVRPDAAIPVGPFDGRAIPRGAGSVDVVTLIDVLHHADDPRRCWRRRRAWRARASS